MKGTSGVVWRFLFHPFYAFKKYSIIKCPGYDGISSIWRHLQGLRACSYTGNMYAYDKLMVLRLYWVWLQWDYKWRNLVAMFETSLFSAFKRPNNCKWRHLVAKFATSVCWPRVSVDHAYDVYKVIKLQSSWFQNFASGNVFLSIHVCAEDPSLIEPTLSDHSKQTFQSTYFSILFSWKKRNTPCQ